MSLSNNFISIYLILTIILSQSSQFTTNELRSFIVYCPCMGRFGNQAEQLLGSLLFAKSLNRTLVLPPFISYGSNHIPNLIPFEYIIKTDTIKQYHDVILMSDFMNNLAPKIWPEGQRTFYCYSAREADHCNALKAQPFNTFWTNFNVTEDKSLFYKPLSTSPLAARYWNEKYPPSNHPVLAFVGAPSPFPTHKSAIGIQKYIEISDYVKDKAEHFKLKNNLNDKLYLSMHIRHGPDWKKACELLRQDNLTQLFSSNQCSSDNGELPILQYDTCLPSFNTISETLNNSMNSFKEKNNVDIDWVHIATDYSDKNLWQQLREHYPETKFVITPQDPENAVTNMLNDIYLMAYADVFVGNCVSSFSAFPARIRKEQLRRTTNYFGQKAIPTKNKEHHRDDL